MEKLKFVALFYTLCGTISSRVAFSIISRTAGLFSFNEQSNLRLLHLGLQNKKEETIVTRS